MKLIGNIDISYNEPFTKMVDSIKPIADAKCLKMSFGVRCGVGVFDINIFYINIISSDSEINIQTFRENKFKITSNNVTKYTTSYEEAFEYIKTLM
jgi:hypothetical protein